MHSTLYHSLNQIPDLQLIQLDEVSSTNDFLRDFHAPESCRLVLATAEHQTVGRGQRGNSWESEHGCNLLFSLMVHPANVEARVGFCLSEAIAMAVQQALGKYSEGFSVKWPNDIYYEDRKVAGILIENTLKGKLIASSVIGVGLNVNQHAFLSDAPNPISLSQIVGHDVDRALVLQHVIENFILYYGWIEQGQTEALHQLYMRNMYRGMGVYPYSDEHGTFSASIIGVEPSGHLLLQDQDGVQHRYAFKEVKFVGIPNP